MQVKRMLEAMEKSAARLAKGKGMEPAVAEAIAKERMRVAPESWLRRPVSEFVDAIVSDTVLTGAGVSQTMRDRIAKVKARQEAAASMKKELGVSGSAVVL